MLWFLIRRIKLDFFSIMTMKRGREEKMQAISNPRGRD
jgi:hypothetical protein